MTNNDINQMLDLLQQMLNQMEVIINHIQNEFAERALRASVKDDTIG